MVSKPEPALAQVWILSGSWFLSHWGVLVENEVHNVFKLSYEIAYLSRLPRSWQTLTLSQLCILRLTDHRLGRFKVEMISSTIRIIYLAERIVILPMTFE